MYESRGEFLGLLIAKADAQVATGLDELAAGIDQFERFDCFFDRNCNHFRTVQSNHVAELPGGDELDGMSSEAGSDDAVEGAGGSAALSMAEDAGSRFDTGGFFELFGDDIADTS